MTEVQQAEILETIRLIAPEFSEDEKCTDEFVGKFIKLSAPLVSAERFGEYYIQAMAYLTAHRMKMAGYGDTSLGSLAQTGRLASVTEAARVFRSALPQHPPAGRTLTQSICLPLMALSFWLSETLLSRRL